MSSHRLVVALCLLSAPALTGATAPQDLALDFVSPVDGSRQPYRLFLPSAHDGQRELPLLVALHGTGGDQNKYFDHPAYHDGIYKAEAERRGVAVLCPLGTDADGLPTEWRGTAEIYVLAAIEDVRRRFRIDAERIVCTGQSMGGTGTTYLCSRYPDLFAAGIPLASTYGHLSLIANLRDVPMLFIQGGQDWPVYAATGPVPITAEMRRLGYHGELWTLPEAGHNTFGVSTPRVFDWALRQRRVAHPRHLLHRAYFPQHGRAWWVEIQALAKPGGFAEVEAMAEAGNRLRLRLKNTARLVIRPDPELHDLAAPLMLELEGREIFRGHCSVAEQLTLRRRAGGWKVEVGPRRVAARTDWQACVLGTVGTPPTWAGGPETTLGNWLCDAMRDLSGADIALCTKGHYRVGSKMRAAPLQTGQSLRFIELANWLRPSDAALAVFTLAGADLRRILEWNVVDGPNAERFLVQVSGCRYRFDRRRPQGSRIVDTDLDPRRLYRIVCNSSAITRTDTLNLGDFFGRLNHEVLEANQLSTAWHYLTRQQGRLEAGPLEGRVVELK